MAPFAADRPAVSGLWRTGLFGGPDSTDNGDGSWDHEFASGGEDLPSYTVEVGMPKVPAFFIHAGVKLNSIALEFTRVRDQTQARIAFLERPPDIGAPVAGTLQVCLDGDPQLSGWSVDTTTGLVTFGMPPALRVEVAADFEFDVPVRFDTDHMAVTIETSRLHAWQQIPIVESRI